MAINGEMNEARCGEIFELVRRAATVDEVEVAISGGISALTRFANNEVTQNVSEEGAEISVRVQMGGRTARATTNRLDDESLRAVVRRAEALARVQEEDSELLPMMTAAEQGSAAALDRCSAETESMGAAERAEQVARMIAVARREGLNSAGIYATATSFDALFNSQGVARWHRQTLAEASVTMEGSDSSGWQKQNAVHAGDFDAAALAAIAAEKAKRSAHPVEVEPGRWTVILEPPAVVDLIGFLAGDFSGLALLEQRSCLNGRLGEKLFGDNITIVDDVSHAGQVGASWDGEGAARQRLSLVERGVVREVAQARATAARLKSSEFAGKLTRIGGTGHGFSLPNEGGEAAVNVVFEVPEERQKSVEDMIASTERGLLITRLWYIREVDAFEKILTGMTRDGTFLVENGRVKCGVRNLRFNQSVIELLRRVIDLGRPRRACGEEAFDMVAPAMRAEGFNFTETTKF